MTIKNFIMEINVFLESVFVSVAESVMSFFIYSFFCNKENHSELFIKLRENTPIKSPVMAEEVKSRGEIKRVAKPNKSKWEHITCEKALNIAPASDIPMQEIQPLV